MFITAVSYVLAMMVGGVLAMCSLVVLFFPIFLLLLIAGKIQPDPPRVKDEVVQAQWEYDRKFRRRD